MDKLEIIGKQLNDVLKIPYRLGQWNSNVTYPYSVGEITEEPVTTEDGHETSTLLITVFHRGDEAILKLEEVKEKIKNHFNPIYGLRGETDSGTIVIYYDGSFFVPTGEADLKKIQINLSIKEWKGAVE